MKQVYFPVLGLYPMVTAIVFMLIVGHSTPIANAAINDDEPKKALTIKDIMDQAHKQGLLKKVATEKATEAEVKTLHELYTKLAELTPPKGDQSNWVTKTKALVDAAQLAVDKDPKFKAKLKAASKCADCHKVHK